MSTEEEIRAFAEKIYADLIQKFNQIDSPFALLSHDDATFVDCPGVTSANLCNVLIGGKSNHTATFEEFIRARADYDASCIKVSYSICNNNRVDGSQKKE